MTAREYRWPQWRPSSRQRTTASRGQRAEFCQGWSGRRPHWSSPTQNSKYQMWTTSARTLLRQSVSPTLHTKKPRWSTRRSMRTPRQVPFHSVRPKNPTWCDRPRAASSAVWCPKQASSRASTRTQAKNYATCVTSGKDATTQCTCTRSAGSRTKRRPSCLCSTSRWRTWTSS